MNNKIVDEIRRLREERDAVILAHNYQRPEVQDIADYTGDSLGLSREAAEDPRSVIVFCGVDFMAESAAILSPQKTVLFPEPAAQCPMAAMITPEKLRRVKEQHPGAAVVCYVNTSAAVKAESDICCTSSNAVQVVESLDAREILFVPDENLALYVQSKTSKTIIPWEGYCPTHNQVLPGDVLLAREEHPEAEVLVHPECKPGVVDLADQVFSTGGMLRYAQASDTEEFIIGTESGMLHPLAKACPDKKFYPVSSYAVCPNMKMNTLETIQDSLEDMRHVISVPEETRARAKRALDRMLEVGRGD